MYPWDEEAARALEYVDNISVGMPPPNYQGIGDAATFDPAFYWGLRAPSFARAGLSCVKLRRDGASPGTQDFSTQTNGELNAGAINAFLAGSAGSTGLWVDTLHNQGTFGSGGADMVQSNTALQPQFSVGGGPGGKPAMLFTAANSTVLNISVANSFIVLTVPYSFVASTQVTTTGNPQVVIFVTEGAAGIYQDLNSSATVGFLGDANNISSAATDGVAHGIIYIKNGTSSTGYLDNSADLLGGTNMGTVNLGDGTNLTAFIGGRTFQYFDGFIMEVAIFNASVDANHAAIHLNQKNEYNLAA
jgi:hypothetical protein